MKHSALLLLLILLGVVGVLFLPLFVPVIQNILFSIYIVCFFLMLVFTVQAYCQYYKIKSYFWKNLDNESKECINYGFVRPYVNFQANKIIFFLTRKEINFQKKRNELLLKHDPELGMRFIKLETKIDIYLEIIVLLHILLYFSWSQL